jgi:hypothetical protein
LLTKRTLRLMVEFESTAKLRKYGMNQRSEQPSLAAW